MPRSVTSLASTHRIRSSHTPGCRHQLTSLGSFHCLDPTHTWRNEALATCATYFTTPPSHQICLPLGYDLRCLPRQKVGRGQALQGCDLPCGKEAGSADLRFGEIQTAIPQCRITAFLSYAELGVQPDVCFAIPFLNRLKFLPLLSFQT